MLDRLQIEAWAFRILRAIQAGHPAEDESVELKSDWPTDDYSKTAHQIAALANASLSPHIMWLIGVDEKEGVVPFSRTEPADWWASVAKSFDPPAPAIQIVATTLDDRPFVALIFDTDARPYVVKQSDGGRSPFVVPWRDANRTRTATRAELVSLLDSHQSLPELDVLQFTIRVGTHIQNQPQPWNVRLWAYVNQRPGEVLVLPQHRSSCLLDVPEFRIRFDHGGSISFGSPQGRDDKDAVVEGPGRLFFQCLFHLPYNPGMALPHHGPTRDVEVIVSMGLASSNRSIVVQRRLAPLPPPKEGEFSWGGWSLSGTEN